MNGKEGRASSEDSSIDRHRIVRFALPGAEPGGEPELLDVSEMVESGAPFRVGSRLSLDLVGVDAAYSVVRTEHIEQIDSDGRVHESWLITLDHEASLPLPVPSWMGFSTAGGASRSRRSCRRRE